jgi:serine protease Do
MARAAPERIALVLSGILLPLVLATTAGAEDLSLANLSGAAEGITERVSPSVVQILSTGYMAGAGGSEASDLLDRLESTGSGVIVDPSGYIVTNAHVVAGARRIRVVLSPALADRSGESILTGPGERVGAQLVGLDRETDLAVIRIQRRDLPALEFADSDELRQGQLVFALGSPRGLMNSVSMGVVSATARQLGPDHPMVYVQTDATINPGNSGGPLVDVQGRIVGINTLILTDSGGSEGLGFAAPSNIVRAIYEQLREGGRVRRGTIGVSAQTINPSLAEAFGLDRTWGVILGDVFPGGPADRAGLLAGDIVVSVDGKPMENGRQLDVNIYRRTIGQSVPVVVERGGAEKSIRVEVTERTESSYRFEELVSPERNLVTRLGILGLAIDSEIVDLLPPLREPAGVLVVNRAWGGVTMDEYSLQPGDVIHEAAGRRVRNVEDLRDAVESAPSGSPVGLRVERAGQLMFLAVERR